MNGDTIWADPPGVDTFGRVIPGITLEAALAGVTSEFATDRNVANLLARISDPATYNIVVRAALAAGHTHYPPDLAGRRCPIRETRR